MNPRPCALCILHPRGLEGHEDLRSGSSGPSNHLTFKCGRCGSRWQREYEGQGVFVWIDRAAMGDPHAEPLKMEKRPPDTARRV